MWPFNDELGTDVNFLVTQGLPIIYQFFSPIASGRIDPRENWEEDF